MQFPKVAAAQRLQTLLLLTTLLAIVLAALLLWDLFRSLSSTVVADASKSLTNALGELLEAAKAPAGNRAESEQALQRISYDVLRSYPDVEGGYLVGSTVVGHTFPTYTEPGSGLRLPEIERRAVLESAAESRRTGRAGQRVFEDGRDLVVVSALAAPAGDFAAWGQKRYLDFANSRDLRVNLLLVLLVAVGIASVAGALSLSFRMQRGFAEIQAGLNRLRTDASYRLPGGPHELEPIVAAINSMAESRQRMEGDLRREDRLRVMGRVVAGIAHEIRNPLNSIRLAVQVLARKLGHAPEARETVPLVQAEVDRLDSLLRSLLVFGADEPGRLLRQPVRPLLDRTVALVMPQLKERGIQAEVTGAPDAEARINGDHLQQAVMNLLLNAIDAAGPDGRVCVSVEAKDGQVEVSVADSGPGLTEEERAHLFEAFYTTKVSGTGLGLAVTRTLLEKMGASIEYAAGQGEGARFRIVLPVAEGGAG